MFRLLDLDFSKKKMEKKEMAGSDFRDIMNIWQDCKKKKYRFCYYKRKQNAL